MKSKISFCCHSGSRKRRSPCGGLHQGMDGLAAQHAMRGLFPQPHPITPKLKLGVHHRLAVAAHGAQQRHESARDIQRIERAMLVARHPALDELAHQLLALAGHGEHVAGEFLAIHLGEIVRERLRRRFCFGRWFGLGIGHGHRWGCWGEGHIAVARLRQIRRLAAPEMRGICQEFTDLAHTRAWNRGVLAL